ncbi:MAG TPA: terminase large subunit, partial [Thiolinea sp.]|nr:terminase large subunit [Thiolinea sp.]
RKGGSELWVSFNPADEADATYQQFVAPYLDAINTQGFHEDEYLYVRRVNFNENPFFPDVLRVESARLKQQNYKKWLHVYQGEPDMEYLDSLIEPEWFEAAVDAHQRLGFEPRGERVCGFDPADTGADAKARALRYGVLIEDVASWLDGDVTDATQKAVDDALAFRATALVYDNIGNGASVKTYATLGGAPAGLAFHGFGAGDTPDDPDQAFDAATADETAPKTNRDTFRNKRAQYWWLLRGRFYRTWEAVVKGRYHDPLTLISLNGHMPQRAQLKRELVKVQRKRTPGLQLIQIESKEEMRKRGIPSPNLADSLMMSFAVPEKSSYRYERRPVRR